MIISAFLVVFTTAAASSAVISAECPKQFPKEMRPLWKCCKMEVNPNSTEFTEEQMDLAKDCFSDRNSSAANSVTPSLGYDCELECVMVKLGFMGEDKTIIKEKIVKSTEDEYGEEFHEPGNKALETCIGRNYNTRCPSGIDGMIECFMVQVMMNCPAQHWKGGEDCKETKKIVEKCGETMSIFADYDDDD